MAYPQVSAPYGLQPINLIGGQVFAGATRSLPIQYGYGTNIFFGDFVVLSRGFITRAAVSTGTTVNQATGIFLGCSYTNPLTKQKTFSEYWPASTLAGDAVAIVCEDPDTVFKAVVCSATTVVASGALALVGTNLSMIDNSAVASSLATGNSATQCWLRPPLPLPRSSRFVAWAWSRIPPSLRRLRLLAPRLAPP